jgi:hypothetical protein
MVIPTELGKIDYSNSYENVTLLLNLANFYEAFAKVC